MQSIGEYSQLILLFESMNSLLYKGRDEVNDRDVVIKIPKATDYSELKVNQLLNEYNLCYKLNFPGIRKAYNTFEFNYLQVLVLEYISGMSLKAFIKDNSNILSIRDFLQISIQIVESLGYLHELKIIHRDINPNNIIINPSSNLFSICIIDFGFSCRYNLQSETGERERGVMQGTLEYISPELTGRMNRNVDYRSDLYSLGITLYELFTGTLPFPYEEPGELIHAQLARLPLSPFDVLSESAKIAEDTKEYSIVFYISSIIMKLLAKIPEDRYQSCRGLLYDLNKCIELLEIDSVEVSLKAGDFDYSTELNISQKLFGRERELRELHELYKNMTKGKKRFSLITGESGIGKTALVNEFYAQLNNFVRHKIFYAYGKYELSTMNIPYSGFIRALNQVIDKILLGEEDIVIWKKRILDNLGVNAQIILDIIPSLYAIIGEQPEVPELNYQETMNRFALVFKKFIQSICNEQNNLILFFDDLQWADIPSINLLKNLLNDPEISYILILATCRNTQDNIKIHNSISEKYFEMELNPFIINLDRLNHNDLLMILKDTFKRTKKDLNELTEITLNKTNGNPFFIKEFINSLYKKSLIYLHYSENKTHAPFWDWEIHLIKKEGITENVLQLLYANLQKIDSGTLNFLEYASSIGNRFSIKVLLDLLSEDKEKVIVYIEEAINNNFIISLEDSYNFEIFQSYTLNIKFKFTHDKIYEIIQSNLSEEKKNQINLQIGLYYLSHEEFNEEQILFEIVDHLNRAIPVIADRHKILQLAGLNNEAGLKAKHSGAYQLAYHYFMFGLQLLPVESWEEDYDLSLSLYMNACNAAFFSGDYEFVATYTSLALKKNLPLYEKIGMYEIILQSYSSQNQSSEGTLLGLKILSELGMDLPSSPDKMILTSHITDIRSTLSAYSSEDILKLPEMQEPVALASLRILNRLIPLSYFANPALFPIISCKGVELSIRYGIANETAVAFVNLALIFCSPVLKDYTNGYRYGLLSLQLLARNNTKVYEPFVLNNFYSYVALWKEQIYTFLPELKRAYTLGLEVGDLEFACYSITNYLRLLFFSGINIKIVLKEFKYYLSNISSYKQIVSYQYTSCLYQAIWNLNQTTDMPLNIKGEFYDEDLMLPFHYKNKNSLALAIYYYSKILLCFLFNDLSKAINYCEKGKEFIFDIGGHHPLQAFIFMYCLTYTKKIRNPNLVTDEINKIEEYRNLLLLWSENCPENYLHMHYLVEAEVYRLQGENSKAKELYDYSIQSASNNRFMGDEAIAYELAGLFYKDLKIKHLYEYYINTAYNIYNKWQAYRVAYRLKLELSEVFINSPSILKKNISISQPSIISSESNIINTTNVALETIIKSSSILAQEIRLDKLLKAIANLIIENAGAEKAYIILSRNQEWYIEVFCDIREKKISALNSMSLNNSGDLLSLSVVKYVIRKKITLIYDNIQKEQIYLSDYYVQTKKPLSVLCIPLVIRGELNGILYLENNLTPGAFSKNNVEILKFLSGQISISLENAYLYENLERQVGIRTEELKESEANLKAIIDNQLQALILMDSNMVILKYNELAVDLFYSITKRKLVKGINYLNILSDPEEVEIFKELFYSTLQGKLIKHERKFRMEESELWLEMSIIPVTSDIEGIRRLCLSALDITDRKKTEEQLKILSQLTELSPAMIMLTDSKGKIIYVNPKFTEVTGYQIKEIEGKNPNFLSARLFDKSHYEELWNTILSGKIWHGEFYNRKKNGDLYWELASITSIKNSKGEVVNFIAVKEDITERKRIEKELKEAKEQADYANKAKSEFLAMMSHEIRTPLNGIIGMSKLLNDLKLNDEQREYIQAINISSESLLTVINDILDYSKIESGKLEFEYKPFSPVSCILDSIKIFTLRAREKGILLEYEILNNIPQYVAGDVIRTRQILINLIGNAIKFTNEGQIKVNISSKEMHNENVEITYTVKDTGIGISKNNLEKLFQSFSQADSSISRKYGGTGLGLAISKRLSELMGGKIWVNSVLGEGSEFSFSIIAGKTTYIKPIETPQDFFDKQQIPEIKILLAEDNEINRLLALRILQKAKLNADVALNGEDAIRLFKEKEYDLILMDIQMPEMDGIEATSHIRNLSQSNDKPVIIAMTANAMTGDKEQYLLSGMNDYISKPIQKEELLEKIKRIQFSS